jgi:hypothetical protein
MLEHGLQAAAYPPMAASQQEADFPHKTGVSVSKHDRDPILFNIHPPAAAVLCAGIYRHIANN